MSWRMQRAWEMRVRVKDCWKSLPDVASPWCQHCLCCGQTQHKLWTSYPIPCRHLLSCTTAAIP